MKRLTRKNNNEYVYGDYIYLYEPIKSIVTKLGQHEAIEEEMGIELITLFKVLKQQKVYCIIEDTIMDNSFCVKLVFRNNEFQLELDDCHYLRLIDYRKTWALTREELEK